MRNYASCGTSNDVMDNDVVLLKMTLFAKIGSQLASLDAIGQWPATCQRTYLAQLLASDLH